MKVDNKKSINCLASGPWPTCGHFLSVWVEFPVWTLTSGSGANFSMNTGMATHRQRLKTIPHLVRAQEVH